MTGRLLTARELADELGVTAETVLRYVRAGELPAIRLPGTVRGRLRFRPDDIDAWLARHETGATDREVLPTRNGRAHAAGYATVRSTSLPTPPVNPATTEEDS